jgi:hypothetical protein
MLESGLKPKEKTMANRKRGKNKEFRCDTIDELRRAFDEIKSVVAGDTRFMAQALMFLAERSVVSIPRVQRKPTEWQRFFAKGMKAGKSPAQIAEEWRTRPRLRKAG